MHRGRPARLAPSALAALAACAALVSSCDGPPASFGPVTIPTDTLDDTGPYQVSAVMLGRTSAVEILYCGGTDCLAPSGPAPTFTPSAMRRVSGGRTQSLWSGVIPGQAHGTPVVFYLRARGGGVEVLDPPEATASGPARRLHGFAVGAPGGPCRVDADCGSGGLCDASKACRAVPATCGADADCQAAFRCAEGRCVLRTRHCAAHVDCLIGEACDRRAGACRPRAPCQRAEDCVAGTSCDVGAGLCRAGCTGPGDCDESERCEGSRCIPAAPCTGSADCPAGLYCEMPGGGCRARGARLCAACTADVDCGDTDDFCLVQPGLRLGVCGQSCARGCPAGTECRAGTEPPQCVPVTACK